MPRGVALVTGASSGMGRAIALNLASRNPAAAVVVADVRREPIEGGVPTDQLVRDRGGQAVFVQTEVRQRSSLDNAFGAARALGDLDTLVNNAGVYLRRPFLEVTEADLDDLWAVNVTGLALACQLGASAMASHGGSIVNLSSVAAYRGSGSSSGYGTTKGAVRALTLALAAELAPRRIRVNAVHPGAVDTAMLRDGGTRVVTDDSRYPMGLPTTQDVANAVAHLCSDRARHVSGTSLTVDGGGGAMG